jgi:hypothetical protein
METVSADMIIFRDASGISWTVREIDGKDVPAARGERCLIFECTNAVRRVWRYPRHWRELKDPELAKLSWGR